MARASANNVSIFSIGGDLIAYLISTDMQVEVMTAMCGAGNARYETSLETKRMFTWSASLKRKANAAGVCQTNKTVIALDLAGDSYLGRWTSIDISYSNSNSRSDGGDDDLAQVQLHRPTTISGSITFLVDVGTSTLLTELTDAAFNPQVTFSFQDGAGTVTIATTLKNVRCGTPESGLVECTASFENGVPSAGGGGLFATGLTGTGAVAYAVNNGADNLAGNAVILSGRMAVQRDGRTEETYEFHCNSIGVPV